MKQIKLQENKFLISSDIFTEDGIFRNDIETTKKAIKQIKMFLRLLAIRDAECPNSRGYEFRYSHGATNFSIIKNLDHDYWCLDNSNAYRYCSPTKVYFKTKEDAEKICDILNSQKFNLLR